MHLGTCIGKLTHSGKFRLTVGALDVLAQHAKYKVDVHVPLLPSHCQLSFHGKPSSCCWESRVEHCKRLGLMMNLYNSVFNLRSSMLIAKILRALVNSVYNAGKSLIPICHSIVC